MSAVQPVEIRSGPAEVIASGTVISYKGNPVEISYGPPTARLKLILVFRDEEGQSETRLEARAIDADTIELTLFNCKGFGDTGSRFPWRLGTLEGRWLEIHLRVHDFTEGDKSVQYTLYLAGEVSDAE